MRYELPKEVEEVLKKLAQEGFQAYIVGGAVRDLLMGKKVSDWDFTTDAKPEEILKVFPKGFYDNKFGTVGIAVEKVGGAEERSRASTAANETSEDAPEIPERQDPLSEGIFEITTMRKEGIYQDFRHPTEVSWTDKIEEDLARRDFTINALALRLTPFAQGKPSEYEVSDPFQGQRDLENKLIRAVGNPNLRFQEDALRLMRAIRIAAQLEFAIEEKTWQAIRENSHLLSQIAWERIRDELFKILCSMNPRPGGQAYIGIVKLREAGILAVILPELERCFGVVQEGPKHTRVYDIGEHSLLTLQNTPSSNPLVRLAALLHDIGKPDTMKTDPSGNVTFYNHEVAGGRLILQIAKRFNLSKAQTDKLFRLVRWHLFTVDERQTDSAIRRFIKNVGLENIEEMMALRVGDRLGGGTQRAVSWRM
ncbi:MAG: HD domain-containing protein, partial [bacterium]|nr:HD domain-containing protein [bacterium]